MKISIEAFHPAVKPEVGKLVLIWTRGNPSETGCWDGNSWVDQCGFEKEVTQWAYFPPAAWATAPLPRHLQPKPKRRLLIVACSATKDNAPGDMPALQRYRGAYYQIIKKHVGDLPEIVILSAEFGFIRSDEPIPGYDRLMDKERASYLKVGAARQLATVLQDATYDDVFVAAGQIYRSVICPALGDVRHMGIDAAAGSYKRVRGGIGEQRAQLKSWLRGE